MTAIYFIFIYFETSTLFILFGCCLRCCSFDCSSFSNVIVWPLEPIKLHLSSLLNLLLTETERPQGSIKFYLEVPLKGKTFKLSLTLLIVSFYDKCLSNFLFFLIYLNFIFVTSVLHLYQLNMPSVFTFVVFPFPSCVRVCVCVVTRV